MKSFHKKRLLRLAAYLEKVPTKHFDMDIWATDKNNNATSIDLHNKCGTVACALGHAGFIKSFRKAGLRTTIGEYGGNVVYKGIYNTTLAAEEFFGLTPTESHNLFMPSYANRGKRTAKHVAKAIRKLVSSK